MDVEEYIVFGRRRKQEAAEWMSRSESFWLKVQDERS